MKYAIIDLAQGKKTAFAEAASVKMIRVNTEISGSAWIADGATNVISLGPTLETGTVEDYRSGFDFFNSIIVKPDPNAEGNILVGFTEITGRGQ